MHPKKRRRGHSTDASTTPPWHQQSKLAIPTPMPHPLPSPTPLQSTLVVDGKYFPKVFRHVIRSVPFLRHKWFTAKDWCKILPRYWGPLKDNVNQITTRNFTRAMNVDMTFGEPSVLHDYTVGDIEGVVYNPYNFGTFATFCNLFTVSENRILTRFALRQLIASRSLR